MEFISEVQAEDTDLRVVDLDLKRADPRVDARVGEGRPPGQPLPLRRGQERKFPRGRPRRPRQRSGRGRRAFVE